MKNQVTKFIAWLLLALAISNVGSTGLTLYQRVIKEQIQLDSVLVDDYLQSSQFTMKLQTAVDAVIRWQSSRQQSALKSIDSGFSYYLTNGQLVATNLSKPLTQGNTEYFSAFDRAFIAKTQDGVISVIDGSDLYYITELDDKTINGNILLAFTDLAYLQQAQSQWTSHRMILNDGLARCLLGFGVIVTLLIYLIITAGRSAKDQDLHLSLYDKIFPEVNLVLVNCLGVGLLVAMAGIIGSYGYLGEIVLDEPLLSLVSGIFTIGWLLFIGVLLSIVRQIKAGTIISHSITFRLLRWLLSPFVELFNLGKRALEGKGYINFPLAKQLVVRQLAMVGGMALWFIVSVLMGAISSSLLVMLLFLIVGEVLIVLWSVNGAYQLSQQLDQGVGNSQKAQQQSESTKTQLITNISHDLKTPLTSIVTYVDLLAKEELPPTADDYVKIISGKAQHLNQMVADLFDLSKSISGNLQLEIEQLDISKLIKQMLAELQDQLDADQYPIKTDLVDHPLLIMSDGQKIYRILQNVLDNAVKYAMPKTRIYITLLSVDQDAKITIVNTANYEMDFTAQDVMQRFVRGDKARSSEGSGLGLSIAESFTHSCGGTFHISIEGDQFKTIIRFPLMNKPK
jgi:signal transduction histidine kinase